MAKLIKIENLSLTSPVDTTYCQELESGNILFFPKIPFDFPQNEIDFLLEQRQTEAANRKNIAYKPQLNKITNFVQSSPEQGEKLLEAMRNYSVRVTQFLTKLLPPYAPKWRLDYASFRPFQERGRQLRTRARNDLLHTDAFPTRPTQGHRILRFFTNINPTDSRYWITSSGFEELARQFGDHGVPFPKGITGSLVEKIAYAIKKTGKSLGLPLTMRSAYDTFMLNLHNTMKENTQFQQNCPKDYWEFPPNSCWMVYTDLVSHAAIAGQYALEHTFIVPPDAMVIPEKAPIRVLEAITGRKMAHIV